MKIIIEDKRLRDFDFGVEQKTQYPISRVMIWMRLKTSLKMPTQMV